MQHLRVHIEYLDGRPAEDQEMPARYEPGQEKNQRAGRREPSL